MIKPKRLLALFLLCSFMLSACSNANPEQNDTEGETSTAVEVQTVAGGEMSSANTIAGQVAPVETVQIFPMLAGKITSLNVNDGDIVTQGQVLFTVDTSTVTSTLGALQQSYNATKAATDQAINTASIGVQNAELAITQAQTALDNVNALFAVGAASSQQVTQAEQGLQQAQSALLQAQTGVEQAKASQQASLAQIQASIDQINAQVALGMVTSPVSGKVSNLSITVGGVASQASPAMMIAVNNELMLSVFASENVRNGVAVGDIADVTISSVSADPMKCTVRTISETADMQTNLYEITLYLPADLNVPVGAFANVTLYTDKKESTIQIPTECILTDGEEKYVFTVSDNKATKVLISTGLVGDGVTEITAGLAGGETLVTKGQSYLFDGADVRIVDGKDSAE